MHVYYSSDYVLGPKFDTFSKASLIAEQLAPRRDVSLHDPGQYTLITDELLTEIHHAAYLDAVRTGTPRALAESNGLRWSRALYLAAMAHCSGVVAATLDAISTQRNVATLSSGLHHARRASGNGYCTFNGLAAGLLQADWMGVERAAVLDVDAHFGGGTVSLLDYIDMPVVHMDLSVSGFDRYEPREGDIATLTTPSDYLADLISDLTMLDVDDVEVLFVNAGMDPFNCGVSEEVLLERERILVEFAAELGVPCVITVAGGYDDGDGLGAVVDLHVATMEIFAGAMTCA